MKASTNLNVTLSREVPVIVPTQSWLMSRGQRNLAPGKNRWHTGTDKRNGIRGPILAG